MQVAPAVSKRGDVIKLHSIGLFDAVLPVRKTLGNADLSGVVRLGQGNRFSGHHAETKSDRPTFDVLPMRQIKSIYLDRGSRRMRLDRYEQSCKAQ